MFLLADQNATFWFPEQASTFAKEVDWFYMAMLYISLFFFVLIVGAMGYFMVVFRDRPGYKGSVDTLHNNWLEFWWTFIPCVIAVWIFARGVDGYLDQMTVPVDTNDVDVVARKWSWSFSYPGGVTHDELHLVVDRPAKLTLRSDDVLHCLFVPVFRAKCDIVPGRYSTMWFQPTKLTKSGEHFDLFCAEYCGEKHSNMLAKVFVHTQQEYDAWIKEQSKPPTLEDGVTIDQVKYGFRLYDKSKGCKSCHSVDGTKVVGPSFLDRWGEDVELANGKKVKFDENYVRESVIEPQAKARKGFEAAAQMPSYQGRLNNDEITALIEYMKSLKKDASKK